MDNIEFLNSPKGYRKMSKTATLLIILCMVSRLYSSTFETESYAIDIKHLCPDGNVSCENVRFTIKHKSDGNTTTLLGETMHNLSTDEVTPARFLGYTFTDKERSYFISVNGTLTISDKISLKELKTSKGSWDYESSATENVKADSENPIRLETMKTAEEKKVAPIKEKVSRPEPLIVIGVPGKWKDRSDIVTTIAKNSGGYLFADGVLLHSNSGNSFELDIYEHDPSLAEKVRSGSDGTDSRK